MKFFTAPLLTLLLSPLLTFAQQPGDCGVKKITVFTNIGKRGGNPAYDPNGDTIVYQKILFNGNYEVAVSDTAMSSVTCLTCDTSYLPPEIKMNKHKGNAEFHPSGNYILFTSENQYGNHLITNNPGAGVNHDIFIMTRNGQQFWKLTNAPQGHAILHPAFSHDGTRVFWAEMYYSTFNPPPGQEYGLWELKIADFGFDVNGDPFLSNIVSFTPRDSAWYESHSFSPDDSHVAFTSHQEGVYAYLGDICVMDTADIGTSNFTNLTQSPTMHDEHAHWSPDGAKISWMSGVYIGGLTSYISELYLMDANGANPVRLTYFSDSSHPEYIQDTLVTADHYWSPDGTRIFGFVHFINGFSWQSELYDLEFNGPCGLDSTLSAILHPIVNAAPGISVSPNPASDHVCVTVPGSQPFHWQLVNVTGQCVLSGNSSGLTTTIDINALPPGMYLLSILTTEESRTARVIKQ